jgi:hypothetical protein
MKPIGRISKSQCQAEKLSGSFMTFGPRSYIRCKNKPIWKAIEKKARKWDGRIGQMSLCDHCKAILINTRGRQYAIFEKL